MEKKKWKRIANSIDSIPTGQVEVPASHVCCLRWLVVCHVMSGRIIHLVDTPRRKL